MRCQEDATLPRLSEPLCARCGAPLGSAASTGVETTSTISLSALEGALEEGAAPAPEPVYPLAEFLHSLTPYVWSGRVVWVVPK